MKPQTRLLLTAFNFATLALVAFSQDIKIDMGSDRGGYFSKWDAVQERMVFHRDITRSDVPAVRLFGKDGTDRSIYPLKDFPEARAFRIWGLASAPQGDAVLAATVEYPAENVKTIPARNLLLTYDSTGALRKEWNVKPYHLHEIAIDDDGNIFAFGDRAGPAGANYPLMVKYSPQGKVLREFLSSSLFKNGDEVTSAASDNGTTQLFMANHKLFLWLATTQEVFRFSLNGDLISRVSISTGLDKLRAETGSDLVRVLTIANTPTDEVVAQVRLLPKTLSATPSPSAMVKISQDGSQATLLGPPPGLPQGNFVGITKEGKLAFLQPDQTLKTSIVKQY
jgi:hypothetical protein